MKLAVQSLWLLLTVFFPGLVFLTVFGLVAALLSVEFAVLERLPGSELAYMGLVFVVGFVIQFAGIATESVAFKWGPYRHRNDWRRQQVFDRKYEILATADPDKDHQVEFALGQFFMAHNIAIAMVINWLFWVTHFVLKDETGGDTAGGVILGLSVLTLLSLYVPLSMFDKATRVLAAHAARENR